MEFAESRLFADCLLLYDGVRRRWAGVLCAICGKQVVRYLPIAVMATGTRSSVTPVVLREDTRPPAYGDKYSEGASRTFYTKYTAYKKRVAHANEEALYSAKWCRWRSLFRVTRRKFLLACTMNRAPLLRRSL